MFTRAGQTAFPFPCGTPTCGTPTCSSAASQGEEHSEPSALPSAAKSGCAGFRGAKQALVGVCKLPIGVCTNGLRELDAGCAQGVLEAGGCQLKLVSAQPGGKRRSQTALPAKREENANGS